jgi:hypothetical protein
MVNGWFFDTSTALARNTNDIFTVSFCQNISFPFYVLFVFPLGFPHSPSVDRETTLGGGSQMTHSRQTT